MQQVRDLTPAQIRDRGYNLMVTAFLIIGGLAFGLPAVSERDPVDKIDDFAVLAIAVIALVWYRWGSARFRRSWMPLLLVMLAIASQIVGIFFEADDRQSLADNATAMLVFVPVLVLSLWEYFRPLGSDWPTDAAPTRSEMRKP